MADPAIVKGNKRQAIAVFDEDARGNLVDIRFYCLLHDLGDWQHAEECAGALPWPAYDFSPDYDTHCDECGALIHKSTVCDDCDAYHFLKAYMTSGGGSDCSDPTAMNGLADECDCSCHG